LLPEQLYGQLVAAPAMMYLSPVLGILAGAGSVNLIEAITRAGLDNILLVEAKNPVYLTGGVDSPGLL
jgi:hypothetical protein